MKRLLRLDEGPKASEGRDIVLVEATLGATAEDSQTVYGAAREMQARVIAVEAYADDAKDHTVVYKGFGDGLAGVVRLDAEPKG